VTAAIGVVAGAAPGVVVLIDVLVVVARRAVPGGHGGIDDVRIPWSRLALAVLLVVAAVVWLRVDEPVEGPVLVELSQNHGVHVADLLSVAMVLLAAAIAWPVRDEH